MHSSALLTLLGAAATTAQNIEVIAGNYTSQGSFGAPV